MFSKGDPENWMQRVERYFHRHPVDDEEHLAIIATYLEGPVAKWFAFKEDREGFRSWEDFRRQLFRNFCLRTREAYERLFHLRQTGSVDELIATLVELINYLPDLLEGAAMAALRPEIKMEVICCPPRSTEDCIKYAIEADDLQLECSISQEKPQANQSF